MRKVKIMRVLLALVLAVTVFAGCGDSSGGDTADTSYVRVWINKAEADAEGMIYNSLIDDFNSADIKTADGTKTLKIRMEFKGTMLEDAINSEILTGSLPDVIAIDASSFAAYVNNQVLKPLDDYITSEEKASYVESVIEQSTIGGKLYGLSGMDSPAGLYYNKEIITQSVLTAAGVSGYGTIENPWSWKDVDRVLKVLRTSDTSADKNKSKIKLNLGFGGAEGSIYLYSSLVNSAGGSFNSGETINGYLNSTNSINGIKMIEMPFAKEAGVNYVYSGSNAAAFAQGLIPMQVYGTWDIVDIDKNYSSFKSKYGVMPMPVYEDESGNYGTVATPCGSWGFAISKDSRKDADAATVIKYLTGKAASQSFYDGIGTFPTHKELFENLNEFKTDGPLKIMSELLITTAVPRPKLAKYQQLSVAYSNILQYIQTQYGESGYNLNTKIDTEINSIL